MSPPTQMRIKGSIIIYVGGRITLGDHPLTIKYIKVKVVIYYREFGGHHSKIALEILGVDSIIVLVEGMLTPII